MLYTFLEHSPFAGAFSQKTVKYFGEDMKDAKYSWKCVLFNELRQARGLSQKMLA